MSAPLPSGALQILPAKGGAIPMQRAHPGRLRGQTTLRISPPCPRPRNSRAPSAATLTHRLAPSALGRGAMAKATTARCIDYQTPTNRTCPPPAPATPAGCHTSPGLGAPCMPTRQRKARCLPCSTALPGTPGHRLEAPGRVPDLATPAGRHACPRLGAPCTPTRLCKARCPPCSTALPGTPGHRLEAPGRVPDVATPAGCHASPRLGAPCTPTWWGKARCPLCSMALPGSPSQ